MTLSSLFFFSSKSHYQCANHCSYMFSHWTRMVSKFEISKTQLFYSILFQLGPLDVLMPLSIANGFFFSFFFMLWHDVKNMMMNIQTRCSAANTFHHIAGNYGFPSRRENKKERKKERRNEWKKKFQSSRLTRESRGLVQPLLSAPPADTVRLFRRSRFEM